MNADPLRVRAARAAHANRTKVVAASVLGATLLFGLIGTAAGAEAQAFAHAGQESYTVTGCGDVGDAEHCFAFTFTRVVTLNDGKTRPGNSHKAAILAPGDFLWTIGGLVPTDEQVVCTAPGGGANGDLLISDGAARLASGGPFVIVGRAVRLECNGVLVDSLGVELDGYEELDQETNVWVANGPNTAGQQLAVELPVTTFGGSDLDAEVHVLVQPTALPTFQVDNLPATKNAFCDATGYANGSVKLFKDPVRAHRKGGGLLLFFGELVCDGVDVEAPTEPPPAPVFRVDPTGLPQTESLPPLDGQNPRPIAVLEDESGIRSQFVSNELWVSSNDEDAVRDLVERWKGVVLVEVDPEIGGFQGTGLPKQFLIRIDTSLADTSEIDLDLRAIDENATGDFRVSSAESLGLLAAAAEETNSGLSVGINWVGVGYGDFRDRRTTEALSGAAYFETPYDPNAFEWPSHAIDSKQGIGVAEAWYLLDIGGKLENRVKIAILDGGFWADADTPTGWSAESVVPSVAPVGTESLIPCEKGPCPWHGTQVASAAMARPDNAWGSAGPAGPIADSLLVLTSGDTFSSFLAIRFARDAGARIANMSYGGPVPTALAFTVRTEQEATRAAFASGMLLFAAAGNTGTDVDATRKYLFVRVETHWHAPCESDGVICVGGLFKDSLSLDSSSNYGNEHVDIYAPYSLWVGPDPGAPENYARVEDGTSISSPFVAGIAALVWAANPSLSARQVRDILYETARESYDDRVKRVVNAAEAVRAALEPAPPAIDFSYPLRDGYRAQVNRLTPLGVFLQDVEDGRPCCAAAWSSDIDGFLGLGASIDVIFDSLGARTLEVTATDSDGLSRTASVEIEVVNTAPKIEIERPFAKEGVLRGQPFLLKANSSDPNEPGGALDCSSLTWTSDVAGDPFPRTGCTFEISFATTGPRTLTVSGADSHGGVDSVSVDFNVLEPPSNLPPVVRIMGPGPDDQRFYDLLTFSSEAVDPEGDENLVYTWTLGHNGVVDFLESSGSSVQFTPADYISPVPDVVTRGVLTLRVEDSAGSVGFDLVVMEWIIVG